MKKGFWMMFMLIVFMLSHVVSFAQEGKNEEGYVFTTKRR
jgi:hypothetical protein